jgi:hypothetical protein
VTLFETVRFWAYRKVNQFRLTGLREAWDKVVLDYALSVTSQFPAHLPFSEVRTVARSVAKWAWTKYLGVGHGKNRGILQLQDEPLALGEKQGQGADYVNRNRRAATEKLILQVIHELVARGEEVTQGSIARRAGISQQAISKHYRHLLPGQAAGGVRVHDNTHEIPVADWARDTVRNNIQAVGYNRVPGDFCRPTSHRGATERVHYSPVRNIVYKC